MTTPKLCTLRGDRGIVRVGVKRAGSDAYVEFGRDLEGNERANEWSRVTVVTRNLGETKEERIVVDVAGSKGNGPFSGTRNFCAKFALALVVGRGGRGEV